MQKATDKGKGPLNKPLQSNDQTPSPSKVVIPPNTKSVSKEVKHSPENKESKEVVVEKSPPVFSLQKELEKVKIPLPLTELLKQPTYQSQVTSFMLPPEATLAPDSLNLQEERPMVVFGPHVEELYASTPPFYVSLVIHDLLLHNFLLDSGASHNLIPLLVMEKLGLQIPVHTRTFIHLTPKYLNAWA